MIDVGTDLTPTERLIMLALRLESNQTVDRLRSMTGTRLSTQLAVALRTLRMAGIVEQQLDGDNVVRYTLVTGGAR